VPKSSIPLIGGRRGAQSVTSEYHPARWAFEECSNRIDLFLLKPKLPFDSAGDYVGLGRCLHEQIQAVRWV
jgi:hypothetical protein